jgi:hypothetical protein
MSSGKSDTVLIAGFGRLLAKLFLLFAFTVINDCSRSRLLLSSVVHPMLVSFLFLRTR